MPIDMNNKKSSSLEIKSHNRGKLTERILLILFSLFVANVMTACSSCNSKQEEAPSATPAATATQTLASTPTPDYSIGDKLVRELTEKKYVNIFDSKELIFYNKVARNVLKLINGERPENIDEDLYGDDREILTEEGAVETKADRIANYKKVIETYCEESIDPNTGGPIDIGNYSVGTNTCLSTEEVKLFNEVSTDARNIAISASKSVTLTDEHLKLLHDFMMKEMYVLQGSGVYKNANQWFQLLIMMQFDKVNTKYIPSYLHVSKTSEPDVVDAEYYQSFFMDMENLERYFPESTEDGLIYRGENDKNKTYTRAQMLSFTDPESESFNINMLEKGIYIEIANEVNRVLNQINYVEGLEYEGMEVGNSK